MRNPERRPGCRAATYAARYPAVTTAATDPPTSALRAIRSRPPLGFEELGRGSLFREGGAQGGASSAQSALGLCRGAAACTSDRSVDGGAGDAEQLLVETRPRRTERCSFCPDALVELWRSALRGGRRARSVAASARRPACAAAAGRSGSRRGCGGAGARPGGVASHAPRSDAGPRRGARPGRGVDRAPPRGHTPALRHVGPHRFLCLLYTSDAADEEDSVDLGGRRIIKKKKK